MKNDIDVFMDEEIVKLKNELEILEERLEELTAQKADIGLTISAFNIRYFAEVGELLDRLFELKISHNLQDANEGESLKNEYREFKQSFENAQNDYLPQLDETSESELKKLYREACKLCHPDIVSSGQHDKAEEIFKELNTAYQSKNILKVKEIYDRLKINNFFLSVSQSESDKKILKTAVDFIKQKISALENEIELLTKDETYLLIVGIENMDEYFEELKKVLQKEIESLSKQEIKMPTISMFYGIIIRMYCAPSEHNPPHFHAYYQEHKAVIDINSCELTDGSLPNKQLKLVLAWAELRKEELLADWTLAQNGELPYNIEPIK
jgi:curved DNA-binding protein CbpA